MPKIKLDRVSSNPNDFQELYEMSVQLPTTGQVVKCQGNSLFNAKEKTFLLASKLVTLEKKLAVERANKSVLLDFFKREWIVQTFTPDSPIETENEGTGTTSDEGQEFLGSLDPTKIIREALNDVNQNNISIKTEYAPTFLTGMQREQLKRNGLARIKPYLKRHLFKQLTSEDILIKFLPTATLSVSKTTCKIEYEGLKWSINSTTKKECKENAVNNVLNELFNIQLTRLFLPDQKELKEKLPDQVLTAKNGKMFTASLAYQGKIFSMSHKNSSKAKKYTVCKTLAHIIKKHEKETRFANRIIFSKYFVDQKSSIVEKIGFILKYFMLDKQKLKGSSRFEPTDWLLSPFERTLLLEIDNNIQIEKFNDIEFKATIQFNNQMISVTERNPDDARSGLILRVFEETGKKEHKVIVVAQPNIKLEKEKSDDVDVKPTRVCLYDKIKKERKSNHDFIEFYKKKAKAMIYNERFEKQRKRGFMISPLCILHNVLMPEKIRVLQEIQIRPMKYETTIELAGHAVTGTGTTKQEAKQDACRLVFSNILKIDWNRASKGRK